MRKIFRDCAVRLQPPGHACKRIKYLNQVYDSSDRCTSWSAVPRPRCSPGGPIRRSARWSTLASVCSVRHRRNVVAAVALEDTYFIDPPGQASASTLSPGGA